MNTRNTGSNGPLDLAKLLMAQDRVVTRQQALRCGFSEGAIQRRLRGARQWQQLLPGIYLTVTGTPTVGQREMAAVLYAGPGGTLTGPAALRRHDLRVPRTEHVDVLVPAQRRRQSMRFVVVHQTRRLPAHVCFEGPVQFALLPRAVADAARQLGDLVAVRAIVAAAVQAGRCTVDQLRTELEDGPVRGSAFLRAALAEVAAGARSAPEAGLMRLIERAGLPAPLYNAKLFAGKELLAIADAWWPEAGLVVEVDSKQWHFSPEDWEATMARHSKLTAFGIAVLHFSPRQMRDQPQEVLRTIRAALTSRSGPFTAAIRTEPAAA